ncbi:carbon storage regulator CsrA [Steroidobacter sp. S1-65]|uniref:Translational regulator CsrA n=1 Tax=Steroidobacter gossypii TaxID=2805490 RepID=A0ABS1WXY3_9GAMM|nr:carbon storage regulator CsrA [Steroidobacter gossypii]
MLVLNRRIGEAVMIADDITVTVLGVKGTQVRLGLAAPSTVPIHREEIFKRIQREQASRRSSSSAATGRKDLTAKITRTPCNRTVEPCRRQVP